MYARKVVDEKKHPRLSKKERRPKVYKRIRTPEIQAEIQKEQDAIIRELAELTADWDMEPYYDFDEDDAAVARVIRKLNGEKSHG